MKTAGKTEARVRGALLRLWERQAVGPDSESWTAKEVRNECNRHGDRVSGVEAVQRVGLTVAKGKGFNGRVDQLTGYWSELDDGLAYTYSRGVFTVRRKPAEARPDPAEIERNLSTGCRFSLAASDSDGYVDADAGAGHTNNALRRRGLLDDRDPEWRGMSGSWKRPLTPLGKEVAVLAKVSARPGGGKHPKGPRGHVARPATEQSAKPDPALTKAYRDIEALDRDEQTAGYIEVIRGGRGSKPRTPPPDTAWVEIHGAIMVCPCGHKTDFTDHVRLPFCARAEAACAGCGARWGTPPAADCEPLDADGFPVAAEATEPRVTKRHLDLMRHATGGKLRAVRNYSISPPGHEWHQDWTELVGMGLAGEGEPPDCSEAGQRKGTVFHVTEAGFRMTYGDVRKPGKRGKR